MSKIYTFEFKKKLKDRIEKITDKKTLEKIRDIIFKYNPKVSVSQNSSGMLLFFHNLNEFTYNRLDYFLNKLDNDKIKVLTASYTDTQEDIKIQQKKDNDLYKQRHPDKYKEHSNNRNIKITCICGMEISKRNIARHLKSKYHKH